MAKLTFIVILLCCACLILTVKGGKFGRGGGGRTGGSGGFPSGRVSRPSPSSHSYGWNTPSRPAPSRPAPSPNYGWNLPSKPAPAPPSRPAPAPSRPAPAPYSHPSPASLSYPPAQKVNAGTQQNSAPGSGFKPQQPAGPPAQPPSYGFKPQQPAGPPAQPPSYGFKPQQPAGPPSYGFKPHSNQPSAPPANGPLGPPGQKVHTGVQANAPPAYSAYPQSPPSYGFKPSVTGGNQQWNLPPAARPGGPPPAVGPPAYGSWNQPSHYSGGGGYHPSYPTYGGNTKYKVVNNNYYNSPGHGYGGYGGGGGGYYSLPQPSPFQGYYYSRPSYGYAASNLGSGAIGLFLGYSLAKMTTPTYGHYSFYDGYRPRYDHYEVHHYYHNKDAAPVARELPANTIIGCVGDSGSICPMGTSSLCTSSGTVMCVAAAQTTVPCTDNRQLNCVKTVIPCINGTDCEDKQNNQTTVSIPCISNTTIEGSYTVVNNTIISNITTTTQYPITTTPEASTKYPITTTESSNSGRSKREVSNRTFCVTIVAVPAEKKETEGEKVFNSTKELLGSFFENAWNI